MVKVLSLPLQKVNLTGCERTRINFKTGLVIIARSKGQASAPLWWRWPDNSDRGPLLSSSYVIRLQTSFSPIVDAWFAKREINGSTKFEADKRLNREQIRISPKLLFWHRYNNGSCDARCRIQPGNWRSYPGGRKACIWKGQEASTCILEGQKPHFPI